MKYDEIFTFKNLYKANQKCKLGKEHKRDVIQFQMPLGTNLWSLFYDLKYKKYQISGYNKFKIYDPKEREIQAINYRDRIVQRTLCDEYLIPLISKYLIYDNAACRKTKGTSFAIKRVKRFLNDYCEKNETEYFIKIDVSKFFESINHDILKSKLRRIVDDDDIFNFLKMLIDSYEKTENKGLPMGNQSSQLFALLYLNDVDHFVKEKLNVKYYVRYMDDMFLLVKTKEEARHIFVVVSNKIKNEGLFVNPKSQITPLKKGNEFIGYRINISRKNEVVLKIRNSSKRRILNKIKNNKFSSTNDAKKSYASYKGLFKYAMSHYFKVRIYKLLSAKININF